MLKINDLQLAFSNSIVVQVNGELRLEAGEIALLTGPTGSGKSTFLNALAGIFPTYTGGYLSGSISNSLENQTKEIPNFGYVFQNPFDGFVQNTVSQEIMFTINQFNLTPDFEWLNQISQVLGLNDLQAREVHSLSDGEGQRVAIAAALATKPRVLLLDEPTSALDSANTKEFLGLIYRIATELEVAIVVSEHRFEPLLEKVSQVWLIENSHLKTLSPAEFANLKQQDLQISQIARAAKIESEVWEINVLKKFSQSVEPTIKLPQSSFSDVTSNVIEATNLTISKLGENVLDKVSFVLKNGSTTAILGRSGAGKSTLLHSLIGDYAPVSGTLQLVGESPAKLSAKNLLGKIALVPQQPGQLFVAETVSAECNFADRWRGLTVGTTLKALDYFDAGINLNQHPRDLSAGQQLWLAISIATAANPSVLLLDEPTRGLDHYGMCLLQELIIKRQKSGLTTIWATHDLDAAASISDNLLVLSNGQLQSFGPPFASFHPALKKHTLLHQVFPKSEALSVQQLSSGMAE